MNSFTMLTLNADTHDIFKELHRPDLTRPADKQDKLMVVILHEEDYAGWLDAPAERAMEFVRTYPAERLRVLADPNEFVEKVLF